MIRANTCIKTRKKERGDTKQIPDKKKSHLSEVGLLWNMMMDLGSLLGGRGPFPEL